MILLETCGSCRWFKETSQRLTKVPTEDGLGDGFPTLGVCHIDPPTVVAAWDGYEAKTMSALPEVDANNGCRFYQAHKDV